MKMLNIMHRDRICSYWHIFLLLKWTFVGENACKPLARENYASPVILEEKTVTIYLHINIMLVINYVNWWYILMKR